MNDPGIGNDYLISYMLFAFDGEMFKSGRGKCN